MRCHQFAARSDSTAAQDTTSIASKMTGKIRAMLADTPADSAIPWIPP